MEGGAYTGPKPAECEQGWLDVKATIEGSFL